MREIMKYNFSEIEKKWQNYWEEKKVYKTDFNKTENKYYTLVMFLYPSGAKLHCGHWYNYGPTDSFARYKKLKGYNVFEPMGYDAFGLPAENYAIKTGVHPYDSTMKNIEDIRGQLKSMGCMYDMDAELMTCVPEYYKWNQWLFIQLYKKGLAYRKNAPVNWCNSCQTVLANEQVTADGSCERCGTTVIRKDLTQWFFKITAYADELLEGLDKINWPEKTKIMQRNWIGKSYGAEINFKVENSDITLTVFTTRPDTVFGVTYVVLAPEHPIVQQITKPEYKEAVEKYINETLKLSEIERSSTVKEKTGVPTGAFAINPVNGEKIPILIADYVIGTYGTGCVMAVPAHDERDFEFAKKYNLPIKKVILQEGTKPEDELTEAYVESGTVINSGEWSGLNSEDFKEKIVEWLEKNNCGKRTINYRLRDWLISRQRYWGTPIPVIHCEHCGEVLVEEDELPVVLPYNVEFRPDGQSPLARCEEFIKVKCPKCGRDAKRDPDTMDTFVDSSWYYFRYLNPKYDKGMFDKELADKWVPVDMYVGGAEHATMHLLYARFIHKFLRDIGLTNSDEPFQTLIHQGTITNQGAKMSKSKGNVVNPDDFISQYGSDVFRMYLMFMGPYEQGGDWSDKGIVGIDRFVQKIYSLFIENEALKNTKFEDKYELSKLNNADKIIYRKTNQAIKKFEDEISTFRFNTAIATLMELYNEVTKNWEQATDEIKRYFLDRFNILIAAIAPHLAEECWQIMGHNSTIFENPVWFDYDEEGTKEDSVVIACQFNGKMRGTIEVSINAEQQDVEKLVKENPSLNRYLADKEIIKVIFVKNKIINFIVK
jgi:leucyl-tRNA synthetase